MALGDGRGCRNAQKSALPGFVRCKTWGVLPHPPGLTVTGILDLCLLPTWQPPGQPGVAPCMPTPSFHAPADIALFALAQELVANGYRFVTGTPATHARVNARPGNEMADSLDDVFGWSRSFDRALLPPRLFELMQAGNVLDEQHGGYRSRIRVSTLHDLTFLHSAYPTTAADAVFFGPDTYRFANAIDAALRDIRPGRNAVDIGCGAGPGGIVVARAWPAADVFMVDINQTALRLARINAVLAGTTNACAVASNLLTGLAGKFDLIVANPPYLVDATERAYRHGGGPLGAGLSLAILEAGLQRLAPGGMLVLYTGAAIVSGNDPFHSAAVKQLAAQNVEWTYRETDPDVFGEELEAPSYRHADRIAAVVLTVINKD